MGWLAGYDIPRNVGGRGRGGSGGDRDGTVSARTVLFAPDPSESKNAILLAAAAALISGVASAAEYTVEKLGTIGLDMVEANPVVFKGQPWLCQYVRKHKAGRFLSLTDMKTTTPEFGKGMGMHCAFVAGDRVYVTANARKHKAFVIMDSADLVNWSEPRTIFEQPDWGNFYNSSMCRADDRYVLVGEVYGKGPEYVMSFFRVEGPQGVEDDPRRRTLQERQGLLRLAVSQVS